MAAKKRKSKHSVESLPEPKLSREEAAKVKGGLLLSSFSSTISLSPFPSPMPLPGTDPLPYPKPAPYGPEGCAATGDTGMYGCSG